jgi:hypothetical protein
LAEILDHAVAPDWRRGEKSRFLDDKETIARVEWQSITVSLEMLHVEGFQSLEKVDAL